MNIDERGTGRTTRRVEEAKAYAKDHPGQVAVYICRTVPFARLLERQHGDCGVRFIGGAIGNRIAGLLGRAFVDHDADLTARDLVDVQAMNSR